MKYLALVILLQSPEPRISRVVWGAAIFVLLLAVTLLVVFLRRLKRSEKEQEEDWSLSRRSLFVDTAASSRQLEEQSPLESAESNEVETAEESTHQDETTQPKPTLTHSEIAESFDPAFSTETVSADAPIQDPSVEGTKDEPDEVDDLVRPTITPVSVSPAEPTNIPDATQQPIPDERPTERLMSSRPTEVLDHDDIFAEDVWADLGPAKPIESPKSDSRTVFRVQGNEGRERFEAPAIRALVGREPFEPPRVEPIVPRHSADHVDPRRESPLNQQKEYEEAPVVATSAPAVTETKAQGVEGLAGSVPVVSRRHKPAGSVLGIPVESRSGPLVLGEPSRRREEVGIGSLSNYGKDTSPEAGRGGAIFLLLTVLVAAGAVLAYLYIPSVNSRVQGIVDNLRGGRPQAQARPAEVPAQAQIYPRTSEATKNMVKARGAVYNISNEPLENLSIEVSLERGEGLPVDTRRFPLTPSLLYPRQQGQYEFDYDGSSATGYPGGYRVTRLLSGETEVKFVMPGQQRTQ